MKGAPTNDGPGGAFGAPEPKTYRGFPLGRVSWGYREQFRLMLDSLHRKGILTDEAACPAGVFEPFLRPDLAVGSEYVLKEFLAALDGQAGWLVRAPELFKEWRRLGVEFAGEKIYLGRRYFQLWGEGHLPGSPQEAQSVLRWTASLKQTDADLAFSFLLGYPSARRYLTPGRLSEFVQNGLAVFRRDRQTGLAYFQMKLRSAQTFAERLSRTCQLDDVRGRLERLFRAVAGRGVRIDSLSRLDSDDLLDRRCGVVCGGGSLFLAERVAFDDALLNRSHYLVATLMAAACHRFGGFCTVHGGRETRRVSDVLERMGLSVPVAGSFLFQVAEAHRLRRCLCERHPGAAELVRHVSREEARMRGSGGTGDELLGLAMGAMPMGEASDRAQRVFRLIAELVEGCGDYGSVLRRICGGWERLWPHVQAAARDLSVVPLSFVPDHDFPLEMLPAPRQALVAHGAEGRRAAPPRVGDALTDGRARPRDDARTGTGAPGETEEQEDEDRSAPPVPAAYLYDEWNGLAGEYYRDWCCLYEVRGEQREGTGQEGEEFRRMVGHVKRLFQRLKPELTVKEKYLRSGDYIDIDALVRFVTMKKARASPRDHFWIKPRLSRRDIAVALLLDVSGSTGEHAGRKDVITVEKEAASALASGLDELGDCFGIFGFTGNGREQGVFQGFKDFDDDWDRQSKSRLMAARPGSSTRMGVALRHAGTRLFAMPARTRLIVLITDGKPMDSDYDPQTRYAHYDVRKACAENHQRGIHTFCVALDPEAAEGLEVMFPRGRCLILRSIDQLPEVLSRAYLRLTRM